MNSAPNATHFVGLFNQSLLDSYSELRNRVLSNEHDVPKRIREMAYNRLLMRGWAGFRDEAWKYTNLSSLLKASFALSSTPEVDLEYLRTALPSPLHESRVVLLNGQYSPELSSIGSAHEGLSLRSLRSVFSPTHRVPAEQLCAESELTSAFGDDADPRMLFDLHTAFLEDGLVIKVGTNQRIKEPLEILNLHVGGSQAVSLPVLSSRVVVIAGQESSIELVENISSVQDSSYLHLPGFVVRAGSEAEVRVRRVQQAGPSVIMLGGVWLELAQRSQVDFRSFEFGGSLVRNEVFLEMSGKGANALIGALSIAGSKSHIDHSITVQHHVPDCVSRQIFRGVFGGQATGSFSGTIVVDRDAQKTNAYQSNSSLLLSEEASSNSRPQLKIFADDVKCSHGATVGQLDRNALFYLRSRGVPEFEARRILAQSFGAPVLEGISESLRESLELTIEKSLSSVIGSTAEMN